MALRGREPPAAESGQESQPRAPRLRGYQPLDIPDRAADFLRAVDLAPTKRATLDRGVTVPGQSTTS
ncbi:hypothetical protein GCM10010230_24430 [Streptomyces narbonensis]|nr:hypothetical protein GCM10010230_24430 [Streptomyces narbonensis]